MISSRSLEEALRDGDKDRIIELSMPTIRLSVSKLFSLDPSITQDDLEQAAVEASLRAIGTYKRLDADGWRAYVYRVARNAALKSVRKAARRAEKNGPVWSLDKDMHIGEDRDGYTLHDYTGDSTDLLEDLVNKQMRDLVLQLGKLTDRERIAIVKRLVGMQMGEHEHSASDAKRKLRKAWHGVDNTNKIV